MPVPFTSAEQKTPIRILFVIARGDAFGGSSRHVRDLAGRLQLDGHDVKVLVGGNPSMEVPRRLEEEGVPYTCIPSLGREINPFKDLAALISLSREIRRFAPDIVSTHASKGGFLGRLACLGLRVPVIYTPHCWSFVDGFPKARLYHFIERIMARFTTRIVSVCEHERLFGLSRGVGEPEQTIRIYNGIGEIPPHPTLVRYLDKRRPVRIVMVGRFEDQKDHPLLLRALSGVRDLDWRLTLVGEGPRKEECVQLAKAHSLTDRIDFAGYSSTVEEHLANNDLFVLATNWEGMPRSILEAMRAGLPVIASDVGGCRESVSNGETGIIVPRGAEERLRSALRELINNDELRERMGRRAFKVYCEKFSFQPCFETHVKLYESVLGGELAIQHHEISAKGASLFTPEPEYASSR